MKLGNFRKRKSLDKNLLNIPPLPINNRDVLHFYSRCLPGLESIHKKEISELPFVSRAHRIRTRREKVHFTTLNRGLDFESLIYSDKIYFQIARRRSETERDFEFLCKSIRWNDYIPSGKIPKIRTFSIESKLKDASISNATMIKTIYAPKNKKMKEKEESELDKEILRLEQFKESIEHMKGNKLAEELKKEYKNTEGKLSVLKKRMTKCIMKKIANLKKTKELNKFDLFSITSNRTKGVRYLPEKFIDPSYEVRCEIFYDIASISVCVAKKPLSDEGKIRSSIRLLLNLSLFKYFGKKAIWDPYCGKGRLLNELAMMLVEENENPGENRKQSFIVNVRNGILPDNFWAPESSSDSPESPFPNSISKQSPNEKTVQSKKSKRKPKSKPLLFIGSGMKIDDSFELRRELGEKYPNLRQLLKIELVQAEFEEAVEKVPEDAMVLSMVPDIKKDAFPKYKTLSKVLLKRPDIKNSVVLTHSPNFARYTQVTWDVIAKFKDREREYSLLRMNRPRSALVRFLQRRLKRKKDRTERLELMERIEILKRKEFNHTI